MPAAKLYQTSHIKPRRHRSTADEVDQRRTGIWRIVEKIQPATVRQVFYQASVHGLVEKTEGGYAKVQTDLVWMRRAGFIPYDWLADSTRWMRKPRSHSSIAEALEETARLYRKNLWHSAGSYVEIWLEKDALAGVLAPITYQFDVPLMVARGYASLSFLHGAAENISEQGKPAYIYHLGDFDPSGVDAGRKIEATLREMAPNAEINFERLAVVPWQIAEWNLPGRPTKLTDTRAKAFGDHDSVELDSIPPDVLRNLVSDAISRHLPASELAVLKTAEASERAILADIVGVLTDSGGAAAQ